MPSLNDIVIIVVTIIYYCAILVYLHINEHKEQLLYKVWEIKIYVMKKMYFIK